MRSRLFSQLRADAFEHVDFTFFCGTESLTRKFWREALRAGSTVLDLSGALDQETGVLVRSPWVGEQDVAADLFTPAVVPAHPAALALALLMERLLQAAPVREAAATILLPASEFGRAAMDELHQQTVNLLSFQSIPRATFDAQLAYNLLSGFGENAKTSMATVDARIRRQYAAHWRGEGCRHWQCRRSLHRSSTVTVFLYSLNWSVRWICRRWKMR